MKSGKLAAALIYVLATLISVIGCASKPRVIELENKGSSMDAPTPEWVSLYITDGISGVEALPEFRDRYCFIGFEYSGDRQSAISSADRIAQQQIGAMIRTSIASQYKGSIFGGSLLTGLTEEATAELHQEIESTINILVNMSFSGARREYDWWSLIRRYDPDQKDVYSDGYTAFMLYTIPKGMLNQQIASWLETSVSADSVLYDIIIQLAREILLKGL